ncbi:MAG: hypothetical protein WCI05_16070 [Myxococcales bacterium]
MTPGPGLSLTQAPPLSVPFRFYLGTPLFALLAALLLVVQGPNALASRWMPEALAVTHLFALGFVTQVMVGSLMQMLPVVAGAPVPRPQLVAALVHVPLALGALLLPTFFLTHWPWTLYAAIGTLGFSLAVFLFAITTSLLRASAGFPTVGGMWLATVSLGFAAGLGLLLAPMHAGLVSVVVGVRHLHPVWGLAGWVGLLVVGVSFQVVPLFQLTPPYPRVVLRFFVPVLFATLIVGSLLDTSPMEPYVWSLLGGEFFAFAALTTYLQQRRRRKTRDPSLGFWRTALLSLAVCSLLGVFRPFVGLGNTARVDTALVILFLMGFAGSLNLGMLLKIVPFLCWFHLQATFLGRGPVPHMGMFLGDRAGRRLLRVHQTALFLLAVSLLWAPAHRLAWSAVAVDAVWLGTLLVLATLRYRRAVRALAAAST